MTLDTADIADEFRGEMDCVPVETSEHVLLTFREYLSDDLADVLTRAVLQLETVTYRLGAALLTAVSPRLNVQRTGELYTTRDVPMLRSFL